MIASPLLRNATAAPSFSATHTAYVKSLYRRYLRNALDWNVRRDVFRDRAIEIRVEFERHRNVRNPRELARLFDAAEKELQKIAHPDPHRRKLIIHPAFSPQFVRPPNPALLPFSSHQHPCSRTAPSGRGTSP